MKHNFVICHQKQTSNRLILLKNMCLVPRANNYLPHFQTDSGLPVKVVYEKKRVLNGTKKRKGSSTTALINVNPQTHNRSERPITSKENNSFLFRQIIMLKFAHFKQIT